MAQKRVSSNILIATGPVSSKGDQQRDAETFKTRLPDELPHSAGFAAAASTAPWVVACTLQETKLKQKVLDDVAGICADDAAPVGHIAYFSAHAVSEGITHEVQKTARKTHKVSLDIFCASDIAKFLAQDDLIWVAQHYLELPSHLVPPPESEPAPEWYADLLDGLRKNHGPAALTPGVQGGVTQGLRHATWDEDTNADLPEWINFMGAFLADSEDGEDTELVFRACYEMSVATFRGLGTAAGIEDLVRRAVVYACSCDQPRILDDTVTLVSYWGVMWSQGVARAEASEISAALRKVREHAAALLDDTDAETHPVRAATLTGVLAYSHLIPDWAVAEGTRGKPDARDVAGNVGVQLTEDDVDVSLLDETDFDGLGDAMSYLSQLVDLLPQARAYSVSGLARVFDMLAPLAASNPEYLKVRDGLDAAVAEVTGDSAAAERSRDRASAFVNADKPLQALRELHDAKVRWFSGDTLYGSVLTMRFIAKIYSELRLTYAAKMYACTAAALAMSAGDDDTKPQVAKALLEAAGYVQAAGTWVDAAGLTEVALLARAQFLPDPFDFEKHPDLSHHNQNSILELAGVRTYWPDLVPLIKQAHGTTTDWYDDLVEVIEEAGGAGFKMTEEEFCARAGEQHAGPLLGDVGPRRIIDFSALGVRWTFEFDNNRTTVIRAEALCATLQVLLADITVHDPALVSTSVRVSVTVTDKIGRDGYNVEIDDSSSHITAEATVSMDFSDLDTRVPALMSICLQLLHSVHLRPHDELQALVEPLLKAGLINKIAVGRPYEEATDFFDDDHFTTLASATRPLATDGYQPVPAEPLRASTAPGPGYDRDKEQEAIRERYRVAQESLRFTLPALLADPDKRAAVEQLRAHGWLDWQIVTILANIALSYRMDRDGILPQDVTPAQGLALLRELESDAAQAVPLEWFDDDAFWVNKVMTPMATARGLSLRPWQEEPGEEQVRDLLIRRYGYGSDDVPHTDLLGCVDEAGLLRPLIGDTDE
ncbi:hypothetical protein [Nocardioides panzhihuensis]|uniref:Uncharacterized protein n=1 Tax=Nocardioides panzhihuensis TaxID=860243 RepID=A0A7Z0DK31_9ACTN|nr:hypothetical protein [Nocardioides panzhihuensis]